MQPVGHLWTQQKPQRILAESLERKNQRQLRSAWIEGIQRNRSWDRGEHAFYCWVQMTQYLSNHQLELPLFKNRSLSPSAFEASCPLYTLLYTSNRILRSQKGERKTRRANQGQEERKFDMFKRLGSNSQAAEDVKRSGTSQYTRN